MDSKLSMGDTKTRAWQYYEHGRAYNNSLTPNQYRTVNTNVEFFSGNQWLHIPETKAMSRLAKPVFNIIKRITSLFVAALTSNETTISFDSLSYYDGENLADPTSNAAEYATAEVRNLMDKFKMNYRVREALFDGAQTGDYCAHFYWDADALPYGGAFGAYRGEIQMEMVDGINVMFGNPNDRRVQEQPYVLIVGRDTVENLRAEKERFDKRNKRKGEAEVSSDIIQPDSETTDQIGVGGKLELIQSDDKNGKCLYVYLYEKRSHEEDVIDPKTGEPVEEVVKDKDGNPVPLMVDGRPVVEADGTPRYKIQRVKQVVTSVYVTKATKGCNIYSEVDTGLSLYPIAWGNWEHQKNQYHGRALVTGIIPNQIFINTMFAMVMRHLQLMGFPKAVYNADLIGQWNNEVGQAIAVHGLTPGQAIGDIAGFLQPADMSNQIIVAIDKAMQYTRECLGATDVQMGTVRPDNTSALMVLQSNAEVPLENPKSNLYEWYEDIGVILLDMMGTYYGERPLVRDREFSEIVTGADGTPMIDPMTGTMMQNTVTRRVLEKFDFKQFKHLYLNVRVDVGATSTYSEISIVQTLDNLRRDGTLEVIDYLERIPDKLIPRKAELITELRKRAQTMQAVGAGQPGAIGGAPAAMGSGQPSMGGALDEAKIIQNLPENIQSKFNSLPEVARDALLKVQGQ
ncbi:MAG: hypothetical protein ACI3VM_01270 [Oscillospiraceae bacterium]